MANPTPTAGGRCTNTHFFAGLLVAFKRRLSLSPPPPLREREVLLVELARTARVLLRFPPKDVGVELRAGRVDDIDIYIFRS